MRGKMVGVRLDDDEIKALRKNAGASDSERLRSIIHTKSVADAISTPILERLNQIESREEKIESELKRLRTVIQQTSQKQDDTSEAIAFIYEQLESLNSKL